MAFDSVGSDRGGGEAAWIMHQHMQSDPKSSWPSGYNSENNNWNNMESPYSGYSNYWYPQSHTAGPYTNTYPPGTEVNGQAPYNPQAMSACPNGVYNPGQYSANMLRPSNPFYCSDQVPSRQPQYHNQGCSDQSAGGSAPPPYPVPHCQAAPGYPPGSYTHYGEGCTPNPPYPNQQPMLSRPQHEAWSHSGGYGPTPPQQQWPPPTAQAPHGHYGNHHVRPSHPPPWQRPAPPPYEHKEPPYPSQPHTHPRNQPAGPKPRAGTPNAPPPKSSQFSAPPQIYNNTPPGAGAPKGSADPKPAYIEQPPAPSRPGSSTPAPAPLSDNPSLARVQQILAIVQLLQEDVDEFVGKKTDKSYRCLEELLTKELLELDSVETHGQDAVRQARKEAVQRIQAILDCLEKKAF